MKKRSAAKAPRRRRAAPEWGSAHAQSVAEGKIVDRATLYAIDVSRGAIVAGPHVRDACSRHLFDLARTDLVWDLAASKHALLYIETVCRLSGGDFEGKPFILQPWQCFIVGSLYGWKLKGGSDRFQTAYVEIGKSNGKTPLGAALCAKSLTDGEERAECFTAAGTKEQASIAFKDAVAMVDHSPALSKRVKQSGTGDNVWNLYYAKTASFLRPISSESKKSGARVYFALVDELHEHKDPYIVNMMRRGLKRPNSKVFEISNSGELKTSICWAHHEHSVQVVRARDKRDANWDDRWFGYVAALDAGDDPLSDRTCWVKANPNLGVSLTEQFLEDAVREALAMPSVRSVVLRLNFCVWTDQKEAGFDMGAWDACPRESSIELLAGRSCSAGLDLASTKDSCSLQLSFWPLTPDEPVRTLGFYWIPQAGMVERVRRDKLPYDAWVADGLVVATPGSSTDYAYIRRRINELGRIFRIDEIAFDPKDARQLATELAQDGFTMVETQQNYQNMSPGTHEIEALLRDLAIDFGGNPVTRSHFENAVLRPNVDGDRRPIRAHATARIDGVAALAMAEGRRILHAPLRESLYERRSRAELADGGGSPAPAAPAGASPNPANPTPAPLRRRSVYDSPEWQNWKKEPT